MSKNTRHEISLFFELTEVAKDNNISFKPEGVPHSKGY